MELIDQMGIDIGYVIIGVLTFNIILLIIVTTLIIRMRKLRKRYNEFMSGSNGESLESEILSRFSEVDELKNKALRMEDNIEKISEKLLTTYQKMGLVKYDAFKDGGGKLSFALVLLNEKNDGFIINSMHSSREGCYLYSKEIINGESFVLLSEEEKIALEEAKKSE